MLYLLKAQLSITEHKQLSFYYKYIQQYHQMQKDTQNKQLLGHDADNENSSMIKKNLPFLLMGSANCIWPLAWVYPNEHNFNIAQITMVRAFPLILVNAIICKVQGFPMDFKSSNDFKWLIIRHVIMTQYGFFMSISQFILPLPIVHTICCSGVIFIFLIDYLRNGIKVNKQQGIGLIIGIIGVTMTANADLILSLYDESFIEHDSKFQNYITDDVFLISLFALVFLLNNWIWAYGMVITKQIKNCNSIQITLHQGLVMMIIGGIVYLFLDIQTTPMDFYTGFIFTGFPLVLGQWLFITSLTLTKNTGALTMVNFVSIAVSYVISITRYGQSPHIIGILGAILIVVGVWKTIANKNSS